MISGMWGEEGFLFVCECVFSGSWPVYLVAEGQVLAVLVGQHLGIHIMLGQLHGCLAALRQQSTVG